MRRWLWLAAWCALAQEVDTVIYEDQRRSYSLYDQIEDAAERRALQGLFETRDRGERLRRTKAFLETYPGSGFLSVVYEVAARSSSDLREALLLARQSLRLLPENPSLQASVAELEGREWKAPEPLPVVEGRPARYAGTAACRECHAREHANWRQTGMAKMFRPFDEKNAPGVFEGARVAGEDGQVVARFLRVDGRPHIEVKGERYPVEFQIGSKWQWGFATRGKDGRVHVFPYQYNRKEGIWLNYWKRLDPPGSERAAPENFLKFSPATDYLRNCAPCHTSQLGKDGYREHGVNCEMCHGPSAEHVEARRQGKVVSKTPMEPPVNFQRITAREYLTICGQCHRQSAVFKRGEGLNYSGRSPQFWLTAGSRPLIEFSRKAFYRDGRFRETTFIVEALERSQCYQKGGAHCGHCHAPHAEGAEGNVTSLKYRGEPDRMCTQCHAGYGAAHTKHKAGSEASQCVTCHMPRITNALLFKARTHTIDDIPDATMARRFGPLQSPYVCGSCHPKLSGYSSSDSPR